jgi:Kdo2-lipid IVA lauroyltransferase/acyltransferase
LARLGEPIPKIKDLIRYLRYLAEAAALVAVMAVFAALPVEWASNLGGYVGRKIGPRLGVSRRAYANLRRAMPCNSEAENRRIVHGMWDNLGRTMGEFPHINAICADKSAHVEIVNAGRVSELLDKKRPAILFGGHFANWEVGPSVIHRLMGGSLLSVFRASNNPWVNRLLRGRMKSRRAVAKGAEGGRVILCHLTKGGHVAMLVDQKLNDGIAVPFFGRDAMTAPAIARLALRFGCPIVPVRVERLKGARFRFTVLPRLELADKRETAANVRETMKRVTAVIESWAKARPEQWLWIHRRWPKEG